MAAPWLSVTQAVPYAADVAFPLSSNPPSHPSSPSPTSPGSDALALSPFSGPTSPLSGFTTLLSLDERSSADTSDDDRSRPKPASNFTLDLGCYDKPTLRRSKTCAKFTWPRTADEGSVVSESTGDANDDERDGSDGDSGIHKPQRAPTTPSDAGTLDIYTDGAVLTRCAPSPNVADASSSKSDDWHQHSTTTPDDPELDQASLPRSGCDGLAIGRLRRALAGISMTRVRRIDSESSVGSSVEAGLSFSVGGKGHHVITRRRQVYKLVNRRGTIDTLDGVASCSSVEVKHGQACASSTRKLSHRHRKDAHLLNQWTSWEAEYVEPKLDDNISETDPTRIKALWSSVQASNQYWLGNCEEDDDYGEVEDAEDENEGVESIAS